MRAFSPSYQLRVEVVTARSPAFLPALLRLHNTFKGIILHLLSYPCCAQISSSLSFSPPSFLHLSSSPWSWRETEAHEALSRLPSTSIFKTRRRNEEHQENHLWVPGLSRRAFFFIEPARQKSTFRAVLGGASSPDGRLKCCPGFLWEITRKTEIHPGLVGSAWLICDTHRTQRVHNLTLTPEPSLLTCTIRASDIRHPKTTFFWILFWL